MRLWLALLLMFTTCISMAAEETASGVVGPLDNDGMYVITVQGQTEVRWNKATQVAIKINFRNFRIVDNKITYPIHSSKLKQEILLPQKQAYARFERRRFDPDEIKNSFLVPRGMKLYFTPIDDHLPTTKENYFAGKVNLQGKTCTIGEKTACGPDRHIALRCLDRKGLQTVHQSCHRGWPTTGQFTARQRNPSGTAWRSNTTGRPQTTPLSVYW